MAIRTLLRGVCVVGILATGISAAAPPADEWLGRIKVPAGFRIALYSASTPNARSMTLGDDGVVYVGSTSVGQVYALNDADHDGVAERTEVIASGLNAPNGVAFFGGDLFIAEISRIVKLEGISGRTAHPPAAKTVIDGYPRETHHGLRYLRIGPDGKLYVPVGAPCNICESDDEIFATITRVDRDGQNRQIFARGVRNTVGFDWDPQGGELWFTDNGRDWMGNERPADELNAAPQADMHFGYPFCHAGDIPDPEFGKRRQCNEFVPPIWKFGAHVAALGIRFYRGSMFPTHYRKQLFVAQHGSWNRSPPQGYRVVMVTIASGKAVDEEVVVDGWLQADGKVLGRPVDLLELADGSLLISDDQRGVVYRLSYSPDAH